MYVSTTTYSCVQYSKLQPNCAGTYVYSKLEYTYVRTYRHMYSCMHQCEAITDVRMLVQSRLLMLWVNLLYRLSLSHYSTHNYQRTRYCIAMTVALYNTYVCICAGYVLVIPRLCWVHGGYTEGKVQKMGYISNGVSNIPRYIGYICTVVGVFEGKSDNALTSGYMYTYSMYVHIPLLTSDLTVPCSSL